METQASEERKVPEHIGWGAEKFREPPLNDGEELIFDEPGRVLGNVCYRSHYLRVVAWYGLYTLVVRHGAGVERVKLGGRGLIDAIACLNSNDRYLTLYAIYHAASDARRAEHTQTQQTIFQAFADGRLKKRKYPRSPRVKVWIEAAPMVQS